MDSSLHPLLSKPAPRRTPYCVDCYQNGGKVTVATRMFGDDELCEPHYLALCKDMGVEPEVITLSEAKAANGTGSRTRAVGNGSAGVSTLRPVTSDVGVDRQVSVLAADFSDSPISSSSQRPDSSVAPAAEACAIGLIPPLVQRRPQVAAPQTPSAANPQPQPLKEPTMSKCKCGCGEDLKPGTARQFKMGHKSKQIDNLKRLCACGCGNSVTNRWDYIKGHDSASWLAARKAHDQQSPPVTAANTNGHAMPPVAITNGNGHGTIASDGAYLVPCQVSEWAMDRIWLRLTPEEKAELLFRPPEAPQKEQQEPAHHA